MKTPGYDPVEGGSSELRSTANEDAVVREFDSLIRYFSTRFRVDSEDLFQVGRIALIESLRQWKGTNGASVWTHARKAVLGAMLDYQTREISRRAREELAGDGLMGSPGCAPDSALELKEHLASLPPRESSVLKMHWLGLDADEIAKRAHISRSRVYQLLQDSTENIRKRA